MKIMRASVMQAHGSGGGGGGGGGDGRECHIIIKALFHSRTHPTDARRR